MAFFASIPMWLTASLTVSMLSLLQMQMVDGFATGAPASTCASMTPNHQTTAQQGDGPFTVNTSLTNGISFTANSMYQVTIASNDPSIVFQGFLCQARPAASAQGSSPQGTFDASTVTGTQLLSCSSRSNSAITHSQRLNLTSITLDWTAPATPTNDLQIRCTVVQERSVFYVQIASPTLMAPAAATTTAAATTAAATTAAATTAAATTAAAAAATTAAQSNILNGCSGSSPTKFCAIGPADCTGVNDCQYIYTHRALGDNLEVELFTKTNAAAGWVAIGYSKDDKMGDDDVLACDIDSTGMVNSKNLYNNGRSNVADTAGTTNLLADRTGSRIDGGLYCKLNRTITPTGSNAMDFDLSQDLTYLIARSTIGTASATAQLSGQHSVRPVVVGQNISSSTTNPGTNVSGSGSSHGPQLLTCIVAGLISSISLVILR